MWYRDRDRLLAEITKHGSVSVAARANGTSRGTVQPWAQRFGIHSGHKRSPGGGDGDVKGDDLVTSTLPEHPRRESSRTPEQAIKDHGYDPGLWDVVSLTDNYWQGSDGEGPRELTQSKVTLKRRVPSGLIIPARTDAVLRMPPRARKATKKKPLLVALPSDPHCPAQHPGLESCFLEWLGVNQPDRIVNLGDAGDYAKPSRHRPNLHERHQNDANECGQAVHDWWRRVITKLPGAECDQLVGNHDVRPSIGALERYPDSYNVCRPGEDYPWHDPEYLYGLDKLGVTYHRPQGEYHESQLIIAPGFLLTHGTHAGPHGGAMKAAARHEGSRAQGHDHKQALTYVVRYRDGEPHQHVSVSVGTMSKRDLGYRADPDTCLGFATLVIHDDGYWNVELARYDDRRDRLVWRDQMYTAA